MPTEGLTCSLKKRKAAKEETMKGRMVFTVRPINGARINLLDSVLSQRVPAVVAKTVAGGQACFVPDSDGNFEVRLLDSSYEEAVKKTIEACCFELVGFQDAA